MPGRDMSGVDNAVHPELRVGRNTCQCPTCDLFFTSVRAFDFHLIIGKKDTYCRTPEQMRKIGMVPNKHGVWMCGEAINTGKGTGRKRGRKAA